MGYDEARSAIKAGSAKPHALWILLSNESDRDGLALKPRPWEGPGEYQHVEFDNDYWRLIRIPPNSASLIDIAKRAAA